MISILKYNLCIVQKTYFNILHNMIRIRKYWKYMFTFDTHRICVKRILFYTHWYYGIKPTRLSTY